jgi:predicted nucleic acid-binding protein
VPIVVADTGPLHYLVLIEAIELLPRLFDTVFVPEVVHTELNHPRTPGVVRDWISTRAPWLKVKPTQPVATLPMPMLGNGERAAIALARSDHAELILMDDRAGVTMARACGFAVTGTLGVLDLAARRRMIDLADSFARLQGANFRCQPAIMDELLARYEADQRTP